MFIYRKPNAEDVTPIKPDVITRCDESAGKRACAVDGDFCRRRGPWGAYVCTRPKGHTGPHIACGGYEHNYIIWED